MFSPSASIVYRSALSTMRTQASPAFCSTSGSRNKATPAAQKAAICRVRFMVSPCDSRSGTVRDTLAEQARRAQREHADQHDERKDVDIVAAQDAAGELSDVAGAERLDQPEHDAADHRAGQVADAAEHRGGERLDRKSTRLNSSHHSISYAVFCLKK